MIADSFYKLPTQKRRQVISAAARLFATKGFHSASVNDIAASAGVSVGFLYSYFDSKEDIFEAVFLEATQIIADVQTEALSQGGTCRDKLKALIVSSLLVARRNSPFVEVYMSLSAPGMEQFAKRFAPMLEEIGLLLYKKILDEGIASGEIRSDLDTNMAAYVIDNTVMALYNSLSNTFMRIHRNVMLGNSGRITKKWAEEIADRALDVIFSGIEA